MKGMAWEKISQTSTNLTYEVVGRVFETLINKVVKTRRAVKLTVTIASKKKSLKKFVAYTMLRRRNVGR